MDDVEWRGGAGPSCSDGSGVLRAGLRVFVLEQVWFRVCAPRHPIRFTALRGGFCRTRVS